MSAGTETARYRVMVEWERGRAEADGFGRVEPVGEAATAGGAVALLAQWRRAPGVVRAWYESRSGGVWREGGRAG